MTEEFIHYIWKYRLLPNDLETVSGEQLTVIHPGEHNFNSGPDFFNARIRIGNTIWAGNVEIHVAASDWFRHGHQGDPAYENTILHIVYHADAAIKHTNGDDIPTVEIKDRFPADLYSRYSNLMSNTLWIPCMKNLVPCLVADFCLWAPALAVERLMLKSESLRQLFESSMGGWEETLYRFLAHGFGFKINAAPMELLARTLPYKILARHRNNLLQQEALLFGQAGMLKRYYPEDYPKRLRMEYEFLRDKYGLIPVREGMWKYMRLRPASFPTIRLSQFANLIGREDGLVDKILKCSVPDEMFHLFAVHASPYWNTHFTFDKISKSGHKTVGEDSILLLAINVVAPFRFFYGMTNDLISYKEDACAMLESLPNESNAEIRKWRSLGFEVTTAMHSQALIQLKREYCDKKKCLACRLGNRILKSNL